jgi:hypothetical protein
MNRMVRGRAQFEQEMKARRVHEKGWQDVGDYTRCPAISIGAICPLEIQYCTVVPNVCRRIKTTYSYRSHAVSNLSHAVSHLSLPERI